MALFQPRAELDERNMVNGDVFAFDAAAFVFFGETGGEEEVGDFRSHAGGGWAGEKALHGIGAIAGFFEEFSAGGFLEGFATVGIFVTDEPGGDFDDGGLHGMPVLLHENDFLVGGEGEDTDDAVGIGAFGEFPAVPLIESKKAAFRDRLFFSHTFV